jgi:hypothetical protein
VDACSQWLAALLPLLLLHPVRGLLLLCCCQLL